MKQKRLRISTVMENSFSLVQLLFFSTIYYSIIKLKAIFFCKVEFHFFFLIKDNAFRVLKTKRIMNMNISRIIYKKCNFFSFIFIHPLNKQEALKAEAQNKQKKNRIWLYQSIFSCFKCKILLMNLLMSVQQIICASFQCKLPRFVCSFDRKLKLLLNKLQTLTFLKNMN